ncbi:MAG: Stp1/IreP family PP2C-type Ser/Thr phosphatase [Selenomonadaceae bacterium]|nr:Stp1/IreP family PP2C-type Ser/Thr phosphatase [Selenomonadaceae bacterium]
MLQVYQATDIGCVRATNEDSLAVFEPQVYVVADGMGGEAAGEVASRILTETLQQVLGQRETVDSQELAQAIQQGNAAILQCVQEHPEYQGMGTTATALHAEAGTAYWAHVGDSRLYLWRQGELRQITRDHSYVEDLVENGTLTPEEARVHPSKNMLTRAVGVAADLQVDEGTFALQPGDQLLLATDGLMKHVTDGEIAAALQQHTADPARQLVDMALNAGGSDNVTAIVVVLPS